jgi:hypothetical protein
MNDTGLERIMETTIIAKDPIEGTTYRCLSTKTVLPRLELELRIDAGAYQDRWLRFFDGDIEVGNIYVASKSGEINIPKYDSVAEFVTTRQGYHVKPGDGEPIYMHPIDFFMRRYAIDRLNAASRHTVELGLQAKQALERA